MCACVCVCVCLRTHPPQSSRRDVPTIPAFLFQGHRRPRLPHPTLILISLRIYLCLACIMLLATVKAEKTAVQSGPRSSECKGSAFGPHVFTHVHVHNGCVCRPIRVRTHTHLRGTSRYIMSDDRRLRSALVASSSYLPSTPAHQLRSPTRLTSFSFIFPFYLSVLDAVPPSPSHTHTCMHLRPSLS